MKTEQFESMGNLVLYYLGATEIDAFVVAELQRINGLESLLIDIVKGKPKAASHQIKAAIYVLGILKKRRAIPALLQVVKSDRTSLQLAALAALGDIGLDEPAKTTLVDIAHNEKTEPFTVAYALEALGKTGDPKIKKEFEKKPPAHADDSGVIDVLSRLKRGRLIA